MVGVRSGGMGRSSCSKLASDDGSWNVWWYEENGERKEGKSKSQEQQYEAICIYIYISY